MDEQFHYSFWWILGGSPTLSFFKKMYNIQQLHYYNHYYFQYIYIYFAHVVFFCRFASMSASTCFPSEWHLDQRQNFQIAPPNMWSSRKNTHMHRIGLPHTEKHHVSCVYMHMYYVCLCKQIYVVWYHYRWQGISIYQILASCWEFNHFDSMHFEINLMAKIRFKKQCQYLCSATQVIHLNCFNGWASISTHFTSFTLLMFVHQSSVSLNRECTDLFGAAQVCSGHAWGTANPR